MGKLNQTEEFINLLNNEIETGQLREIIKIISIKNNNYYSNAYINHMTHGQWFEHFNNHLKKIEILETKIIMIFEYLKSNYSEFFPKVRGISENFTVSKDLYLTELTFEFESNIEEIIKIMRNSENVPKKI